MSRLQSPQIFLILQHWFWLKQEPFVFTFNFKILFFLVQESVLCLFLYWFPVRTEHELTTWVTLSTFSLQNLHRRDRSWWPTPFLLRLSRLLVLLQHILNSQFPVSTHLFSTNATSWSYVPSVFLKNWQCNAFSFLAAFHYFVIFCNWDSLHTRLKQPLQGMELQEKEAQKD